MPGLQVAGDGVAGDQVADQGAGFFGEVPERAGAGLAGGLLQPVLVLALAGADLAAVAPRGAPADAVRLEQDHVEAGLGEVQRGGEAGVAAADDGDVGGGLALQLRKGRERGGGLGVPAGRVDAGPVVGGQQVESGHASRPCTEKRITL